MASIVVVATPPAYYCCYYSYYHNFLRSPGVPAFISNLVWINQDEGRAVTAGAGEQGSLLLII